MPGNATLVMGSAGLGMLTRYSGIGITGEQESVLKHISQGNGMILIIQRSPELLYYSFEASHLLACVEMEERKAR